MSASAVVVLLLVSIVSPDRALAADADAIDASNRIAQRLLDDMLTSGQTRAIVSPALQWLMLAESVLALHKDHRSDEYASEQQAFLLDRIGISNVAQLAEIQRTFRASLKSDGVRIDCRYWATGRTATYSACPGIGPNAVTAPTRDSIDAWTAGVTHGAIVGGIDYGFELNDFTQSVVAMALSLRSDTLPDLVTPFELGSPPVSYVTGHYQQHSTVFQKYSEGSISAVAIALQNDSQMVVFRAPDWQRLADFGHELIPRLPSVRTRFVDASGDVWISEAIRSKAYLFSGPDQRVYLPAFGGLAAYGIVQRGSMQSAARSIDLSVQGTLTASDPSCCLDYNGTGENPERATFDSSQGNSLLILIVDRRGLVLFEAVA